MFSKYFILLLLILFTGHISAQVDSFCAESGNAPSLDSPFAHIPYVFGKVIVTGVEKDAKFPDVSISLVGGQRATEKLTISKTGNYCFRLRSTGATLVVTIDGIEVSRKTLPVALGQLREDFQIEASRQNKSAPPSVVSAKFFRPANPQTEKLYRQTADAERNKDSKKAIGLLKEIVTTDPADFVAWAKLGSVYQERESYAEALAAYKKCLEQRIEYTPAWINVAVIRISQKQYEAAILVLKQALEFDPGSARIFQLLGESYLQTRQGALAVEALNKALEFDPIGMAKIHLQLAHLYQLAKANNMAAREYKAYLKKIPDHPDKRNLEEFIRKNPDPEK